MITRYALFQGNVQSQNVEAFRQAVLDRLVPLWKQFTGATEVRVTFSEDRDEGAPEFPLVLAVSYPDVPTMEKALESPARAKSREVTMDIVGQYFTGDIHHHITQAHVFEPA